MALNERVHLVRFLIGDRATALTSSFDEDFAAEAIRVNRAPVGTPRAHALLEHIVGTVPCERRARRMILGRRDPERVLAECVAHHDGHRCHRVLDQLAPLHAEPPPPIGDPESWDLCRRNAGFDVMHDHRLGACPGRIGFSAPTR